MGDMAEMADEWHEGLQVKRDLLTIMSRLQREEAKKRLMERQRENFSLRHDILKGTYFSMDEIIEIQKGMYEVAQGKKVGERTVCPACGWTFNKKHPKQTFCSNQRSGVKSHNKGVMTLNCKDWFWNRHDERKRRYAVEVLGL